MFWIGFIVGWIAGITIVFIVECLCLISGQSDNWMEDDEERKKQKKN